LALAACNADNVTRLAPGTSLRSVEGAPAVSRHVVLASGGGFTADFQSRVAALGGTLESIHPSGIAVVTGLSGDAVASLAKMPGVNNVQVDVEFSLDQPIASVEADASAVGDVDIASQANPTTASRYVWQWNMRAIQANAAWAAGKLGDAGVTVAILDTGLDYNINDLNGLVDLSRSTSFVASDNALAATYFPSRNNVTDFHGHGTNVATQVSSKAAALAGVTSKTTLIGVKVLGRTGSGSLSSVLNGVLWAADHGADVANMSLGGGFHMRADQKADDPYSGAGPILSLINRTFNYAASKGMLIVVSAGNDIADLDHNGDFVSTYCDMPHVVCVSAAGPAVATDNVDASSYYTNFGRSAITVAGPGGNADAAHNFTVSAWPWGNDIASWVWSYCPKDRLAGLTPAGVPVLTACAAGNRLSGYIGTSQASPHVAGLAALLVAEHGHGNPSQIKHLIEQSADDLGQRGTDPYYGRGRINVKKALGL
jgi:subtilisin family serine protease